MVTSFRWFLLVLATTNGLFSVALAQQKDAAEQTPSEPVAKTIAYWVEQLDHDLYLRREMASTKLADAGPAAIDGLVQVIRDGDLEVVERAMGVIREIALSRPPRDDGGAWDQLNTLAAQSAGRRASSAESAIEEVREHRAVV